MKYKKFILAILSGILLSLSFPKFEIYWLAWFGLIPLLIALTNAKLKESFFLGFLTGFIYNLILVYWVVKTIEKFGNVNIFLSTAILILFSIILALYFAAFTITITYLNFKPIYNLFIIPVSWIFIEYIRTYFPFSGFPWELLGYSQYKQLSLIQISDIFGVYGVSFIIIMVNVAIFYIYLFLFKKKSNNNLSKSVIIFAIVFLLVCFSSIFFYGKYKLKAINKLQNSSQHTKISVVQGNVDQSIKWDPKFQMHTVKKYIELSNLAISKKPKLIVWPETALPFYFIYNEYLSSLVFKNIINKDSYFLIGSPSFTAKKNNSIKYFNSAYLISPNGKIKDKYNKMHLVPFGEYVPLKKWLPFINKLVVNAGEFYPGKDLSTITCDKHKLGVLICFEVIFPNISRKLVKKGANLLINITNDAWYGKTSAPYQHFSMAVFRAIENRRYLIRAANTGISGFIDATGKIVAKTDLFQKAVLTKNIPFNLSTISVYTSYGYYFPMFCSIIILVLFAIKYFYLKRNN